MTLDPRNHAVRPDLADVRLAEYVFAPHYAAPVPRMVRHDTALMAGRAIDAEVLGNVASGDIFEMLDLVGGTAWGIAPAQGLVGYVAATALGDAK